MQVKGTPGVTLNTDAKSIVTKHNKTQSSVNRVQISVIVLYACDRF